MNAHPFRAARVSLAAVLLSVVLAPSVFANPVATTADHKATGFADLREAVYRIFGSTSRIFGST